MGIHTLSDDQQNATIYCPASDCTHHNCAAWHPMFQCAEHDGTEELQRVNGQEHVINVSHPAIMWTSKDCVQMPRCPGTRADGSPCTSQTTLKVAFTAKELRAPNLQNHPMVPRHLAFAEQLKAVGNVWEKSPHHPDNMAKRDVRNFFDDENDDDKTDERKAV